MKGFKKNIILQKVRIRIKNIFRFRANYICPFCQNNISHFKEIGEESDVIEKRKIVGAGIRLEGCPYCKSTDRERLVLIYLKKELKIFKKTSDFKILHFAPERNLTKELLLSFKENYICGDLFTDGYSYPKHVENMNILAIPFANNEFNLVICNHVLEHVEEDYIALQEIKRVLKPGGIAILQVPISANTYKTFEDPQIKNPELRHKFYGQVDHVRIYGQEYPKLLEDAGFKVNRINISHKHEKYKLNPNEDIFIAEK